MTSIQRPKIAPSKVVVMFLMAAILIAGLLGYVWKVEKDNRDFKHQVHLLELGESDMRDYTNTGCAPWHHSPKEISNVDGCYLHTYAYYNNRAEESTVRERLKSNGWAENNQSLDFYISPRGVHTLDAIFFKNINGKTFCAGIEKGEKSFNLHVLSSSDDNCRRMISSSLLR